MKLIIAGSRTITNYQSMLEAADMIPLDFYVDEVVSGMAKGADHLGEWWAEINHIPVKAFYPDWEQYGKGAGLVRNTQMGEYADALLALWDGKSKGTKHMIEYMTNLNKPVWVFYEQV